MSCFWLTNYEVLRENLSIVVVHIMHSIHDSEIDHCSSNFDRMYTKFASLSGSKYQSILTGDTGP